MKFVTTLLLVCALSAAAAAQEKTDKERAGLLGAVRAVRTEVAELAPGEVDDAGARRVPVQAVTFDARGNKVKQVDFSPDGSASQTRVYTADAEGRATGYEEFMGALAVPRKHVYVLDEGGRRVEYKIVQPDGAAGEKYRYKYDARGRLLEASLFEHKGALITRYVYSYDANGRQAAQIGYNADGSVSSVTRSTYDARGRLAEMMRLDGRLLTYRVQYAYDRNGRVLRQETAGSVLEEDVPPSEAHAPGRLVYVYKGKGRPGEAVVYDPDGAVRERVLIEYDSRGNWVKRTRLPRPSDSGNVVPQRVEYRTIEYF
jgi:YD repeat-containing protein